MDLGCAARTAIGEVVDLEIGRGEGRGSVLELGSGLAVAGEGSWGAAGGDVAAPGQGGSAVDGEGGGLVAAGPGSSGGDAVRRTRSATVLAQTIVKCRLGRLRCRNKQTSGARYGNNEAQAQEGGMWGRADNDARRCARRRCSLGEEQGLKRDRTVGFSYRTGRAD